MSRVVVSRQIEGLNVSYRKLLPGFLRAPCRPAAPDGPIGYFWAAFWLAGFGELNRASGQFEAADQRSRFGRSLRGDF
jgi:hypothetical protein